MRAFLLRLSLATSELRLSTVYNVCNAWLWFTHQHVFQFEEKASSKKTPHAAQFEIVRAATATAQPLLYLVRSRLIVCQWTPWPADGHLQNQYLCRRFGNIGAKTQSTHRADDDAFQFRILRASRAKWRWIVSRGTSKGQGQGENPLVSIPYSFLRHYWILFRTFTRLASVFAIPCHELAHMTVGRTLRARLRSLRQCSISIQVRRMLWSYVTAVRASWQITHVSLFIASKFCSIIIMIVLYADYNGIIAMERHFLAAYPFS